MDDYHTYTYTYTYTPMTTSFEDEYLNLKRRAYLYRGSRSRAPQFAGAPDLGDVSGDKSPGFPLFWHVLEDDLTEIDGFDDRVRYIREAFLRPPYTGLSDIAGQVTNRFTGVIMKIVREIQRLNPPPAVAAWAARSADEVEKIRESPTTP